MLVVSGDDANLCLKGGRDSTPRLDAKFSMSRRLQVARFQLPAMTRTSHYFERSSEDSRAREDFDDIFVLNPLRQAFREANFRLFVQRRLRQFQVKKLCVL